MDLLFKPAAVFGQTVCNDIELDTEHTATLPDGERPHVCNRHVLPFCAGTTPVLCGQSVT